jgi:hypothetical protein
MPSLVPGINVFLFDQVVDGRTLAGEATPFFNGFARR